MKELHELSTLFPPLPENEIATLADDIKKNGLREPIILFERKVLDGAQRQRACELAGIEPTFISFESQPSSSLNAGPLAYVISRNLQRRHLTTRQRADIAAKLTNLNDGSNRHEKKVAPSTDGATAGKSEGVPVTVGQAAEMLDVSESSVERARKRAGKTKPKAKKKQASTSKPKPKRDLTAGLKAADSIRKLLNKTEKNGGTLWVQIAGYGIRVVRSKCD